ncbi:hypothetical protein B0H14DRAFT_2583719 [Mycena olivaceomarginata]|nr:hypothetical protein B0H14DRAFT_2583719 [Mycena olivaceomarginata]
MILRCACQHTVSEGPRYDTPRICHGPLAITSSLGAPCLSPELKRARTPISDVGCGGRWFAGDLGMWHQRNGHDDKAIVSSSFGRVWVGYLGEEEEAKRALRWDTVQWGVNLVKDHGKCKDRGRRGAGYLPAYKTYYIQPPPDVASPVTPQVQWHRTEATV